MCDDRLGSSCSDLSGYALIISQLTTWTRRLTRWTGQLFWLRSIHVDFNCFGVAHLICWDFWQWRSRAWPSCFSSSLQFNQVSNSHCHFIRLRCNSNTVPCNSRLLVQKLVHSNCQITAQWFWPSFGTWFDWWMPISGYTDPPQKKKQRTKNEKETKKSWKKKRKTKLYLRSVRMRNTNITAITNHQPINWWQLDS